VRPYLFRVRLHLRRHGVWFVHAGGVVTELGEQVQEAGDVGLRVRHSHGDADGADGAAAHARPQPVQVEPLRRGGAEAAGGFLRREAEGVLGRAGVAEASAAYGNLAWRARRGASSGTQT
jgi:hypothetical protein